MLRELSLVLLLSPLLLHAYAVKDDLSHDATIKRLERPGTVKVSGVAPVAPQAEQPKAPGQAVYEKYCSMCHSYGVAGAPKIKDKEAWGARYQQGLETLYKHAIQGYKGMPAKGNCLKCTDIEIHESIHYILKESQIEIT